MWPRFIEHSSSYSAEEEEEEREKKRRKMTKSMPALADAGLFCLPCFQVPLLKFMS